MKKLLCTILFACSCYLLPAQVTGPVIKANFGVDADLRANYFNGFVTAGNDDWFSDGTPGPGTFIIDTTGALQILARYAWDMNFRQQPFFRGMRYPQFSIINNRMLIDGIFIRDHHGDDSTVFAAGSNKNGMSPADWSCPVSQGIPDKTDILDMMMHVRREGPNLTDSLWMFGGVSLENTTGNRYFDFEMYQTDIFYDRSVRQFFGYGPDDGHTSWQFDGAGNITTTGDIIFTAEYSSSSLSYVEARIWVHKDALLITPVAFDWGGSFDGASAGATYGYANIVPKTAGIFYTGLQCANNTWAGPFALVRQDNSLVTNYNARQYMEFSVNLSKLGLDPLVTVGDPCAMPFRRILVKSRASTSFSAELKDFVGPFDFFRAPRVNASADIPIFCGSSGISTITVTNALPTSLYTWNTPDGNIISDTVGSSVTIDQPGSYIVSQQLMDSCGISYARDTVDVILDSGCAILTTSLLEFNGHIKGRLVPLNWSVGNNESVLHFELERSTDLVQYTPVTKIFRKNGTGPEYYSYTDDIRGITATQVFYRLKIKNINGLVQYSRVIGFTIDNAAKAGLLVSPNPARNHAQLAISSGENSTARILVYDQTGKIINTRLQALVKGTTVLSFNDLASWKSGVYIIKVQMGRDILTAKIIVGK